MQLTPIKSENPDYRAWGANWVKMGVRDVHQVTYVMRVAWNMPKWEERKKDDFWEGFYSELEK